jgi:putative membrane protein
VKSKEEKVLPKSHKIVYGIYIIIWGIMAIDPKYPEDWLLENVLVFLLFPFVIYMDAKHHYSLLSIVLLLIFASMHSLGSHYTYAEMEHFNTITQFFGFERNHYDRLVHFASGLLLFRLIFEMTTSGIASVKIALAFTFTIVVTIATFYELMEWLAVVILNPELGSAFLGTQGDEWDAHKDTLLASTGALINLSFYKHYEKLLHQRKNKITTQ